MRRFENQHILITGGSSGIGLATAKRLVAEGAKVVITGTNAERLRTAEQELGVTALQNDAGDVTAAQQLAEHVRATLGTLDGVFLNAGFGTFEPLEHASVDAFDAQFQVNVRGPLLQAQALAPLVRKGGTFVINTSVVNVLGMANTAIYAATKAAVRSLARTLARELAGRDIRVNAVSPGPIETGFFARTGMPDEAIESLAQGVLAQVPLGRFGKADEVGAVAAFLLSQEASFVTGAEYVVDGGLTQL